MRILLTAAFCAMASVAGAQSDTAALDTLYQTYDEGVFSLPLRVGLRIPSYDRVNGLSLPWGPHIAIPGGRIELDPIVTYRSNLGKVDPSINARMRFGNRDELNVFGGRGTFTNDAWIRSDIINSLTSIGVGTDARNYFRADRVRALLSHRIEREPWEARLSVGANHEFDWSAGRTEFSATPWSIFGRKDKLKMRRPNPFVMKGHLTSLLGAADGTFERDDIKARIQANVETGKTAADLPQPCASLVDNPDAYDPCILQALTQGVTSVSVPAAHEDRWFNQFTGDVRVSFPTFGMQNFEFKGHAVASTNHTPFQRFVYLGGAGTLSTVDLLAFGGDRLVFVRGDYNYPLVRPLLPYVGAPVLSLMYAAGSAGIQELPDFIQNIGVAVGLKVIKVEYWYDPNYQKTDYTHKSKFSIGFSLSL